MNINMLFVESRILCVILALVVLRFNVNQENSSSKYMKLIGWLAVAASVVDMFCIAITGNAIVSYLCAAVYHGILGFAGVVWLNYCLAEFKVKVRLPGKLATLIPAFTVMLFIAISVSTGWIYCINSDGGLCRGGFYSVVMLNYIYPVMAFAIAVGVAKKSGNRREGRNNIMTAACALPVVLSAVQVVLFPEGLPAAVYAIVCSLIVINSNLQHRFMVTDNLTKLPNRYGMDDEIEEQLQQYKKDKNDSFYIIACDMDDFKTINDTWGHPEGDRALKLIANVLSDVAQRYDSEVFRIGGDEFVIITDTSEPGLADMLCVSLKEELDNIDFRDDYNIRMSMGVALYDGSCTIPELINGADRNLYEAKKHKIVR